MSRAWSLDAASKADEMFADEIRRAVEASPRAALPQVAALLWRAFSEGQITEAEAESLSAEIEARKLVPAKAMPTGRRSVGSRPRSPGSMDRRRRWAASGALPVGLACRFTVAEQAALAVIGGIVTAKGDCRLSVGEIAGRAGVSETTVRNAVRQARKLGLVTVEERRLTGFRNDTNVLRIVSLEWLSWSAMGCRGGRVQIREGHGFRVLEDGAGETAGTSKKGYRGSERGRPMRSDAPTLRNAGPWRRSAVPAAG